jgi:hypothetical protein
VQLSIDVSVALIKLVIKRDCAVSKNLLPCFIRFLMVENI